MKLRFEILKRDNFKCCACGFCPAKDRAVELHIDNIIPWSRGEELLKKIFKLYAQYVILAKEILYISNLI